MYQPFIDDPDYLSAFDGQRFILLRAGGDVVRVFDEVKGTLRRRFAGTSLSYIAHPHVTLCGFAAGTPLERVQRLAEVWSPHVSPIDIDVDGLDVFNDPFPVVFMRVRKTPELLQALSTLRRLADQRGPRCTNAVPIEQWTFHMSIAYGAALSAGEWDDVARSAPTVAVAPAGWTVTQAEVVAFDQSREYLGGLYALGRVRTTGDR